MLKFCIGAIALLVTVPARAQTPSSIVDRAVDHDAEAHALYRDAERARARGTSALPPLSISYGVLLLPVETRLGPQRHKLRVAQKFPWPGIKEATDAIPRARASMHDAAAQLRQLQVRRDISVLVWRLWRTRAEVEIFESHNRLLDGLSQSTQALIEVGRAKKSALSHIAFEIAKTTETIRAKNAEIAALTAQLSEWGISEVETVDTPTAIRVDASLSEQHPMLETLNVADSIDSAAKTLQKKRNKPALTLGAEYIEIGAGDVPAQEAGRDAVALTVGVSLPWRTVRSEVAALDAQIVARDFERRAVKKRLTATVQKLVIETNDLARHLAYLHDTSRPLALTVQQDVTLDFESQRASVADVLRAIDIVHHLNLDRVKTLAEQQRLLAEIAYWSGQNPTTEEQP